MEKILSLLTEFKGYFTGISSALEKLTAAQDKVASLESQLSERDASILSLTSDLEKAQGEVNAKGTEIKTLSEQVTAAEAKATAAIAAQGLPADLIPDAEPKSGTPAKDTKPELFGLDKAKAAFASQLKK